MSPLTELILLVDYLHIHTFSILNLFLRWHLSENPKVVVFQPIFFIFWTDNHSYTINIILKQKEKKNLQNRPKIDQKRCAKYLKIDIFRDLLYISNIFTKVISKGCCIVETSYEKLNFFV